MPTGEITLQDSQRRRGLLPENVIVVDESMTSGRGLMAATKRSAPRLAGQYRRLDRNCPASGGGRSRCRTRSKGFMPDRRWQRHVHTSGVVDDGARGPQRHDCGLRQRTYAVLKREFSYLGVANPGTKALEMFEIGRPDLDWLQLAKGMGVPGTRVGSMEAFGKALREGLEGEGPTLIEVPL